MLSRIADSLFWLNRYMERADGMLRTTLSHAVLLLDKDVNSDLSWQHVLETFTYCSDEEIDVLKNDTRAVLDKLLLDGTNPNSLKVIVTRARENARGAQDHITKEVWEHVNGLYHYVNSPELEKQLHGFQMIETIEELLHESTLYTGVADSTMPRGQGWDFMNLGKYIERCLITIEIADKFFSMIDYNLEDEKDILHWRPMLLSLSGYELHLKNYRSNSFNDNALHQVLFNGHFTRSVIYSLNRLNKYIRDVMQLNETEAKEILHKMFGRIRSRVEFADFASLNKETLEPFLTGVKDEVNDFSMQFAQNFFSYS